MIGFLLFLSLIGLFVYQFSEPRARRWKNRARTVAWLLKHTVVADIKATKQNIRIRKAVKDFDPEELFE